MGAPCALRAVPPSGNNHPWDGPAGSWSIQLRAQRDNRWALALRSNQGVVEAGQADQPAELLEPGFGRCDGGGAGGTGPGSALQPVEQRSHGQAFTQHVARASRSGKFFSPCGVTSTTAPGDQRACATTLPRGVDRFRWPDCGSPRSSKAALIDRAAPPSTPSTCTASRPDNVTPAIGACGTAAHAAINSATRSAVTRPTGFTNRPAAGRGFHAVRRCRRRVGAPRARRAGPRRSGR